MADGTEPGGGREEGDEGRLADGAVAEDPDQEEEGESGLPPEGDDPMEGAAPTG